ASTVDTALGFHYAFGVNTTNSSPLDGTTYSGSSPLSSASLSALHSGTYYVFARVIDKDGDYSEYSQQVTVTPAPITVTAAAGSKVYGTADPALTYSITSGALVGSDVFTGTLSRVAGEHVSSYAIQRGTLALSTDYALTYIGADLTITTAPITV